MTRRFIKSCKFALALIICFSFCAFGTFQSNGDSGSTTRLFSTPVRYIEVISDKLDIRKDIIYSHVNNYKGEKIDLKLDVYQPSGDSEANRAAIVFVHGGGMVGGNEDDPYFDNYIAEFAKRGYVVFNIEHRIRDNQEKYLEAMKDAAEDTAAAVDWVVKNRARYRVDKNHIALMGHSSGADIINNLCYNDKLNGKLPKGSIFGAVGTGSGGVLMMVDNGSVKKEGPPCLLIKGTLDEYVPYEQCRELAEVLKKNGINATLLTLRDGTHLFPDDYYEVLDTAVQFLYNQLVGFNIRTDRRLAMEKIEKRRATGKTYTAKQIDFKADGRLDEWKNSEILKFDQLEEYTASHPSASDFSGTAMLGWNENDPTRIYMAATITDDVIINYAPEGSWWRWVDDTIVLRTDISEDTVLPALFWAFGTNGDLCETANRDNTECVVTSNGNTSTYEIAIDLSNAISKSTDLMDALKEFKLTPGKTIGIGSYYDDIEAVSDDPVYYRSIGWIKGWCEDRSSYVNVIFDAGRAK